MLWNQIRELGGVRRGSLLFKNEKMTFKGFRLPLSDPDILQKVYASLLNKSSKLSATAEDK